MAEEKDLKKGWERVKKWEKLRPMVQKYIDKGDFNTARRVLEGYHNSFNDFTAMTGQHIAPHPLSIEYKGRRREDAMAVVYEELGQFEKAAERYEELDGAYAAGLMYEKAGDTKRANEMFRKVDTPDYQGSHGNDTNVLRKAREGIERTEEAERNKPQKLERKIRGTVAVISLLGGLFFLVPSPTGNVIGLNQTSAVPIGGILFIIGILGAFAWVKSKN